MPSSGGQPEPRRRRGRGFAIASVAVCGLVMAIAIATAIRTETLIESTRTATAGAHVYGPADGLVLEADSVAHEYERNPIAGRARYDAIDARLQGVLLDLPAGTAMQRRDATAMLAAAAAFREAAGSYFAAVDAGHPNAAARIERGRLDPAFERAHSLARRATVARARDADRTVAALERNQERTLLLLPLAFALGGLLLFLFLRRSRRDHVRRARTEAEIRLLERAALTDSLTELPNHRAFYEDLEAELGRARRARHPVCVLMLDTVGLKGVNDSLGHQVGDQMLRGLAAHLREQVGPDGRAYRVGGDEFAVLLPGHGALEGAATAEGLRARLAGDDDSIDVAVGVEAMAGPVSRTELVRRADLAMIHAKRSERHVVVYSPDLELLGSRTGAAEVPRQALASALASAVDAKDAYTRSHSDTVSSICALIGARLGLPAERLARLRVAGLLHDVGKIGTPDEILQKPMRLTDAEYELIQEHPGQGSEIAGSATLTEEARWIRHHHERFDGSGYPDGLIGTEIPLESRIILVADAYEALVSDRPYRRGRSSADAIEEIERHAGTQFDPRVVAALRSILGGSDGVSANSSGWASLARPPGRVASRA